MIEEPGQSLGHPGLEDEAPSVWPLAADLMAGVFGLFVLLSVWAVALQGVEVAELEDTLVAREEVLAQREKALAEERAARKKEKARLEALERALAGPLAQGLITLDAGRIGIEGSVLFPSNSAELTEAGQTLLAQVAPALGAYLTGRPELIMISGHTDDRPITNPNNRYPDNRALSVARALTVTTALTKAGLPPDRLFPAGFGPHHPVAGNESPEGRARNRRVEIMPVPRRAGGAQP